MKETDLFLTRLDKCTTTKDILTVAVITDNSLLESYIKTSEVVSSWVGEEFTNREAMIAEIFRKHLTSKPS